MPLSKSTRVSRGIVLFDLLKSEDSSKRPFSLLLERLPRETAPGFYEYLEQVLGKDRTPWRWRSEIEQINEARTWLRFLVHWHELHCELNKLEQEGEFVLVVD